MKASDIKGKRIWIADSQYKVNEQKYQGQTVWTGHIPPPDIIVPAGGKPASYGFKDIKDVDWVVSNNTITQKPFSYLTVTEPIKIDFVKGYDIDTLLFGDTKYDMSSSLYFINTTKNLKITIYEDWSGGKSLQAGKNKIKENISDEWYLYFREAHGVLYTVLDRNGFQLLAKR